MGIVFNCLFSFVMRANPNVRGFPVREEGYVELLERRLTDLAPVRLGQMTAKECQYCFKLFHCRDMILN
jgi:hypothetical protein